MVSSTPQGDYIVATVANEEFKKLYEMGDIAAYAKMKAGPHGSACIWSPGLVTAIEHKWVRIQICPRQDASYTW